MTRLVPLVKRRPQRRANFARAVSIAAPVELEQAERWLEDVKLFAAGWVAGLVVFGTFLA